MSVRDGVARRDDGTIAGSVGRLRDSVMRLYDLGLSRAEALNAVVTRPAALLGVPRVASMSPGSPAHVVVLDDDLRITRRLRPTGEVAVD